MEHLDRNATPGPATAVSEPVAGVIGGLVSGAAYLVAQVSFTAAARPGGAAEPLQRIAAILMGPDAAPPPAEFTFTMLGMALIIHFALAMVFGRIVSVLVWSRRTGPGVLTGALVGLVLYVVNFGLIAPSAFPWFGDSIRAVTLADHVLFGAVAAAVCLALRSPLR
ncbi:hypothetical protein [Ramlibacter sp. AN1133]|uniref:hypothetical protein n=1 Tax=Ramlibacter sp. AN1133 TaxID=3133429 RepID=UPI0030BEAAB4